MSTEYRTPRAIVATREQVCYDTGRTFQHLTTVSNLPVMLDAAATALGAGNAGVLALRGVRLGELVTHEAVTRAVWEWSELRAWTTFRRKERDGRETVVHVALLDELRHDVKRAPLFHPQDDPAELIAERLGEYHRATGSPWYATAGVSGVGALRWRHNAPGMGRQPLWKHELPRGVRGAGPLDWRRQAAYTAGWQPDSVGWVHTFDVNAQYLSALRNARLAWGALRETGPQGFRRDWPGFWLISTNRIPAGMIDGKSRPPVFSHARDGRAWITTPVGGYLEGCGVPVDVLDSLTCDNGQEIGRGYAERLMSARSGGLGKISPEVLAGIKATYAELVGMLAKTGGRAYRPDWSVTVQDLARMNLLRRLDKARQLGRPESILRVRRDAVSYLSPSKSAHEIGVAIGCTSTGSAGTFKFVSTVPVNEWFAEQASKSRVLAGQPA